MSTVNGALCRISGSGPSRLSLAQSTASSTRSPASAGSVRLNSSSGMNAYSPGSGAPPARYMNASLPSWRSASVVASSEPSASPSGFSCVVTRKRSCERSASTTAARSASLLVVVICDEVIDQLRHAHTFLNRRIVLERQLRRALQSQLLREPSLQHAVRGVEPGEAARALLLGTQHADEHACVTEIRRRLDTGHRDEADARILERTERLGEHRAHRLVDAPHAVTHLATPPAARSTRPRTPARGDTAPPRRAIRRRRAGHVRRTRR